MPYIGNQPAEQFTSFATQTFSVSATTSYTLDHAVTNENEIALFVNNVRPQPGSGKAYTATGTALTLSAATASTDTMYCVFLGRALQTVNPATNSITAAMVSNDLISGKDALTSSPADTDELLISDAGVLKRIDVSLVGGKNTPAFYAELSSAQTTTDGSATKVNFNTEVFDSGSVYDNSTNYRFTPGVAGKYFVFSGLSVYGTNAFTIGQSYYYIYKNGSSYASEQHYEIDGSSNTNGSVSFHIGRVLDLDDDDYLEMYLNADVSSGSPQIQGGTGNSNSSYFGAYRLIT